MDIAHLEPPPNDVFIHKKDPQIKPWNSVFENRAEVAKDMLQLYGNMHYHQIYLPFSKN